MIADRFSLRGRRALVTGSSEGIGRAIAIALAEAGAELVLHGLHPDEAGEVRGAVHAAGADVRYIAADFADPDAVATLIAEAGAIDILVSNVAMQIAQPLGSVTVDAADWQFQIMVRSFLALVQGVLPSMRAQGWGRIVTVGSVQEQRPHPDMLIYAALKSAGENMVRNLARQVAADGVTVNNVAPGVIDTARNTAALAAPDNAARILSRIPMLRVGAPEDVAGAVLLLCSDAGRYITGATIAVDGGMSL